MPVAGRSRTRLAARGRRSRRSRRGSWRTDRADARDLLHLRRVAACVNASISGFVAVLAAARPRCRAPATRSSAGCVAAVRAFSMRSGFATLLCNSRPHGRSRCDPEVGWHTRRRRRQLAARDEPMPPRTRTGMRASLFLGGEPGGEQQIDGRGFEGCLYAHHGWYPYLGERTRLPIGASDRYSSKGRAAPLRCRWRS